MREIMIYKDLEDKDKEMLLNEEWYHQRFDGCPYLLSFIGLAEAQKEDRKYDGESTLRIGFIFSHKSDWYLLEKDNIRTTNLFLEKSKSDPLFTDKMMEDWKEDERKYYELFNKIHNIDFSKLNNIELQRLHNDYVWTGVRAFSSSSVIDGFALGSDRIVAKKVQDYLKEIKREEEYNKLFSILTSPVYLSFENEAEISLLKIAKQCIEIEDWENNEEIKNKIQEHQKNYFWIHNNYVDDIVLDVEFFTNEIKNRLKKGKIIETLEHLEEHPKKSKENKEKLMDELNLPQDIRALLVYSHDFTKWQDERKRMSFYNSHYAQRLLEEIGKRFEFSLEDLKMLTPPEIDSVFNRTISKEEIEKRKQGIMIVWKENDFTINTGPIAEEMHKHFFEIDVPKEVDKIHGLCGSVGKVQGKVKVVRSAKEIHKVVDGDIIVAIMTRPDYVVGMRKAAAIVTDEGGVTCHAAIVARELKIPCVIATKFATRVLEDGHLVEVDADNGHVKILRKY